jgi:PAS domain S-box-containing protein
MFWLRMWSDLSLRRKGLIVVAIPTAAVVAIASASLVMESRTGAAGRAADQAMRVIETSQVLESAAMDTSADTRAYFITVAESFRAAGRRDIARFDGALVRLANLVDGDSRLTREVHHVGDIHRARVDEVLGATSRIASGSLSKEEMRGVLMRSEARIRDQRAILSSIEDREMALREASRQEAARSSAHLYAATLICGLFGVVGGVVMSLLFASGITRRVENLRRNVARLKAGQPLDVLPEGNDEIGALGDGIAIAAEMLAHSAAALENALHGIAQADATGRYVSFNKACGELMGIEGNSGPATIRDSVHPDDWWKVAGALERLRCDGRAETEARMVRAGGGSVNVGVTLLPLPETRGSGCYLFLRDITRQKEVESALIRAKNAALAASQAKLEFLAKISHDIRTPLNAILGAAGLLSRTPLNPDQSEYVGLFQRNCQRLVSLINDFLDFSKIEAGVVRVDRVPYRVRETAEEAVATFRDAAFQKGVQIYASIAPGVPEWELGDPARVQQILVNLLSNALKFTDSGHVGLEVTDGGGRLRFEVSDTGPGIRPEDQERIFAAFTQLANPSPGADRGSGLGLAICRELLELMDGKIGVISEPGQGSRFYFSLPLQAPEMDRVWPSRAVEQPPSEWPQGRGPARILIAEDSDDNRLLLAAYLRRMPVEIRFAANGRQAVDAVRGGGDFDLIFMDIDMPEMDGYQAAAAILDWQRGQRAEPTPIVALSAHAMEEAVRASLEAGCVAHIAKPVDAETLLGAILGYARTAPPKGPAPAPDTPSVEPTLVPGYLAAKPAQIEQARNCLATRDFAPIRSFGHNLKGTGLGYGFPGIGEIGSEIEKAAASGDAGRIAAQLEALSRVVDEEARIHAEASNPH